MEKQKFTEAQYKRGEVKALAVLKFKKYELQLCKMGITKKTEMKKRFVSIWNMEHPDFHITVKTLYEWIKKAKSGNFQELIDKRGGYNRGTSSVPEVYQEYFMNCYLKKEKPTLVSCFIETKLKANQNNDMIPGIKAFRRLVIRDSKIAKVLEGTDNGKL